MTTTTEAAQEFLITLTTDIVSAHVANNSVSIADLPALIGNVHSALADLGETAREAPAEPQQPAVSVRTSIKPDYIVCLEDGRKLKTLKRHLMTRYQMSPADYRAKWNLPADYPMVAPNYSARRKELALTIGLGRGPKMAAKGTAMKVKKPRGAKLTEPTAAE